MQITVSGAARRLILALVLGATLVPFAPNTGAVIAKQPTSDRVDIAHKLADEAR